MRTPPMLPGAGTRAELKLAVAESQPLRPFDLRLPPLVVTRPESLEAIAELAEDDARSPAFDRQSGSGQSGSGSGGSGSAPRPASADLVLRWSRAGLDRLRERALTVLAALEAGTLGQVEPVPVRRRLHLGSLLPAMVVLVAAVVTEVVYGQNVAQLLTGLDPGWAVAGAVGFTLGLNALAYTAASALHLSRPALLTHRGAWISAAATLLIMLLAVVLGLVAGGFDAAGASGGLTGGVTGGGEASATGSGTAAGQPLLADAYCLIIAVIFSASFLAHLIHQHLRDAAYVRDSARAARDAARASLDPQQQRRVAITALRAHLSAVPAAHDHGRGLVGAYNAHLRRLTGIEENERWADLAYVDDDPPWVRELAETLDRLEAVPPLDAPGGAVSMGSAHSLELLPGGDSAC